MPFAQRHVSAAMPSGLIVLLLSLLLGLQSITTDLCGPALPVLRSELSASTARWQPQ